MKEMNSLFNSSFKTGGNRVFSAMRKPQRPIKTRIGEKYGRLLIMDIRPKGTGSFALIKCDCGKERWMDAQAIFRGLSKSCGCYQRECASRVLTRHGMSGTKIHRIWLSVLQRTTDPNADYFKRGVTICDRWKVFENFYEDIGRTYSEGMTIDRIKNSRGYEPGNCRWIPRSEQGLNKTNNILIELDGERLPLSVWSKRSGLNRNTIHMRLKRGVNVRAAIFNAPYQNP